MKKGLEIGIEIRDLDQRSIVEELEEDDG